MSLYWSAPYLLKFCNFCLFNPELKNTLKNFLFKFFFCYFFHFDFEPLVHLLCGVLLQILSFSNHSLFYVIISQKRWLCPAPRKQDQKTGQPDLIIISSPLFTYFRSLGLSTVIVENIACAACSLRCCLYFYLTTCLKVVVTTCLIIHVIDSRRMHWDFVWAVRRGTLHGLFCT